MPKLVIPGPDQRTIVTQDGQAISVRQLLSFAKELARRLRDCNSRRVALSTRRVDLVLQTLLACDECHVELLLLRNPIGDSQQLLADLEVDATIDDDRSVDRLAESAGPGESGSVLLCSSGTTGTPKVARHDLETLTGRIRQPGGKREPVWLLTFHPASFAGLQVALTAATGNGQLVACSETSITILTTAALAQRPTHVSGTPTFWRAFVAALGQDATGVPIRQITVGGEAVDQSTLDLLGKTFPDALICHIYASTEAGALFSVKDGIAGFPTAFLEQGVEGVQLRIRDEVLEARSPRAMQGYASAEGSGPFQKDGWIRTGDIVRVVEDRVFFVGRQDSMINVGGSKVMPEEVEEIVLQVPGVRDARVYGKKNPITGLVVAADIVKRPEATEENVRQLIMERTRDSLESYKVPRLVYFVDSIGYSSTGKKERT